MPHNSQSNQRMRRWLDTILNPDMGGFCNVWQVPVPLESWKLQLNRSYIILPQIISKAFIIQLTLEHTFSTAISLVCAELVQKIQTCLRIQPTSVNSTLTGPTKLI